MRCKLGNWFILSKDELNTDNADARLDKS